MYQNGKMMLSQIETLIRQEILTPAKRVDLDTFVCFTESTPMGRVYHQYVLDQLPEPHRRLFHGRMAGESFGMYKLIAVFDIWPENIELKPLTVVSDA